MHSTVDVLRAVKPHTRRAYMQAWRDLARHLGDEKRLLTLTPADVQGWTAAMRARGLAAATICARLAAVAALFDKSDDPTATIVRPQKAVVETPALSAEQVTQLLRAIQLQTPHGAQDFALCGLLLLTGWTVERVRRLRWDDFALRDGRTMLRDGQNYLPLPVNLWSAIAHTMQAVQASRGLWQGPVQDTAAHLFVALSGFAGARPKPTSAARTPLSIQEINRRITRYAKLARLGCPRITSKGLAVSGKHLTAAAVAALLERDLFNTNSPAAQAPRRLRVWRNGLAG
jgi:integrase